ncbi:MAG: TetR/AcrR family transcriptional regulator [Syntrophomonadaceae bacterium]|jgi:AcrR family transcriptional regulator|nr:TetR/AcrR family transcriptional regulator [Syntrophomonadaceae bacterium]HQD90540.1 TetR/AcrR family transcriptional regulator [Syntrophomonadaceae bacterium]
MPKIIDHEAYREKLLHQYFEMFAHQGYLDVTMRQIAEELGVSTGTLYHYFPSKKALLEQLFHMASRRDSSAVLDDIQADDPIEKRLQVFVDYVRDNEKYFQDIVLLSVDYYRFSESQEFFAVMTEADKYYGNTFVEGLQLEPELALVANIFLNGLVYHRLVFPDTVPFDELAHHFQKMFVSYVKALNEGGDRSK